MKIGLIDYMIDEWHANNYPAWIELACEKLGVAAEIAYVWAEEPAPEGKLNTAQWCAHFSGEACDTLEDVCEKSDVIMILAPSNPEKHLPYAERALKFGKPTYIDKTFAPDAASARRMFELSRKYGAPMFSTSALRYAEELNGFERVNAVTTTGGGGSLDEYCIHQIEMIVRLMGTEAKSVICGGSEKHATCLIDFGHGRTAALNYGAGMPFTLDIQRAAGEDSVYLPVKSAFFPTLLEKIIAFYAGSPVPVSEEQTIACMTLREAVLKAAKEPGRRIAV